MTVWYKGVTFYFYLAWIFLLYSTEMRVFGARLKDPDAAFA